MKVLTSQRDRGATSRPDPGDVWLILLLHPGDPGMIPCWPPPMGDFIAWGGNEMSNMLFYTTLVGYPAFKLINKV